MIEATSGVPEDDGRDGGSGAVEIAGEQRALRRFLYVSPYFPPQTRVGSLRALKFTRHLPRFGWHPVVLADLKRHDAVEPRLLDEVPETTRVHHAYSRGARAALGAVARRREQRAGGDQSSPSSPAGGRGSGNRTALPAAGRRLLAGGRDLLAAAAARWNPEWFPLGADLVDVPHAIRAGRRILRSDRCRAIVVNSAPEAALLVGARLSRGSGLPLILDLRDPWAPCELKRPRRPLPQRALVDALERRAVEAARVVVLNTATCRDAYRDHYADLDPSRFTVIPNSCDPDLFRGGDRPDFDRFTLLFLGGFRRHLDGRFWVDVLADLKRRTAPGGVRLAVFGDLPETTRRRARHLGVADMIETREPVPYPEVRSLMDAADLLLLETQPGVTQRVPAKLYDYLASERPILAVSHSDEVAELLRTTPGARVARHDDRSAVADTILDEVRRGRHRTVSRPAPSYTGRDAASALAVLLDRVAGPS